MTPSCIVAMANRRFKGSFELYMHLPFLDFDGFCLDVGNKNSGSPGQPVMRLVFEKAGYETVNGISHGIFQLTGLADLQCPAPYPSAAVSGVLWHRLAMPSGS